jgi:hypothetical protein
MTNDNDIDYDYYAARHFSYVYDSPEERQARYLPTPKPVYLDDDAFDAERESRWETYDPKDWQWGSWDK